MSEEKYLCVFLNNFYLDGIYTLMNLMKCLFIS